ncbi:Cullin-domain-containing protein [Marasmius fiardii PR-910]|nr:Cullin-domain-containing protein [Marasmius fiardii PR-910]
MSLYDAVYNYSTAPRGSVGGSSRTGANLMGADLYSRLVEYFAAHLKALCNKSEAIDGEALPQYYVDEWDRYTRGANCVDKVFLYLNKHWVKRERDEGRTTIYPVYTLALVQWKNSLFDPVNQKCTKLANAVLRLVEKQGNGEAVDQDLVRRVTGSFIALGLDNSNQ